MSIKTKTISVFLSVATVLCLSGAITPMTASAAALTQAQIDSIVSLLQSFGADSATVSSVKATLEGTGGTTGGTGTYTFSTDLKLGSTGTAVKNLQIVLNRDAATQVAASGAGSSGNETTSFGALTKAAVIKFQNKYASAVLTPIGLTAGTGYVGSLTRAKLNAISGGVVTPTTPTTPTVTPQGTGLTVTAGVQPTASLAPYGASRVPFTVVNFTASADGDVTVNSLVVERTGLAADAAIDSILLLDDKSQQLGLSKTLNSVHQVTLNEPFTVKAGTTKTMTLAANRPSTAGSHAGEIAYLSLVSVNTSAAVNGTLPITGVGQTINESLTIGTVSMGRGPLDPNASTTSKEVGATGFIFSSVKVTAGSNEKVRLQSIRWYQSGSAGASDLTNIKTYVDGTAYDTAVSSDGKYYTATFDGGILIDKGFSKEIYIKGDIAGGSARTIQFDIYKTTDLYLKGETYGYGITPPTSTSSSGFHAGNPWYYAYSVTIAAGTMNVSKATSVASQNIAINLASQPLGGFVVDVKGESISVATMAFRLASWDGTTSGETTTQDITLISLYDENGTVVAGPVDITASSPTVSFSDTVTFPVGVHTYTLKGKLETAFANDQTVSASTTPGSDWGTVKGTLTGVTITPSGGTVTGNTMTVKAGALTISVSTIPLQQTVIAGTSQFLFANYVLDMSNSGEDLSLPALQVSYTASSTTNAAYLSSCKLYDGSTVLTTGSNIKSPTAAASTTSFTFDSPLTLPKGTVKTLGLKCDIAGNAAVAQSWSWGYDITNCDLSPTGKVSGQAVAETEPTADQNGQAMTSAAGGSYTVVDDSTSGYTIVTAGTTGVTLLKLKFTATSEDIDIYRVNFQLQNTSTNTPLNLVNKRLTIYDAANPTVAIATADISDSGNAEDYATSTLIDTGKFKVPSGGSRSMLVKGDIAGISYTVGPIQASGNILLVSYDGGSNGTANGNYGKGSSSGTTINGPTISDIYNSTGGILIMKAYPTFAKIDLSTTERLLQIGSQRTLYKFSVTANGGDVYVYKFTFGVGSSTVSATTTAFGLYTYTNSGYSLPDTTFTSDGLLNYTNCVNGLNAARSIAYTLAAPGPSATGDIVEVYMNKTDCNVSATTTYKIPSEQTRWFLFNATVYNVETGTSVETITVDLKGDAAWNGLHSAGTFSITYANAGVDDCGNNDFIWSPNSTDSASNINFGTTTNDWANGYGLTGLPTTNMAQEILQSTN